MDNDKIDQIDNFLKEFIYGFMFNDINAVIIGKANFLAALGLMEYTEIVGGLVTGKLQEKKCCKQNFEAFIQYLGQPYIDLNKDINLYDRVRCGLAHEYFIKGPATIWMSSDNPIPCGILYNKDKDWINFVVIKYFDDFKSAICVYQRQLVHEKNEKLIKTFKKALKINEDANLAVTN